MGAAECKGCSTSDPTSDTVKVGPMLLGDADGQAAAATPEQQKDQLTEEQRLQRAAEEQQAREAAAEEERQRREAEERQRLEAEAEQARLERERAEERERLAHEEQERAVQEREAQELGAAQEAAQRMQQELEEQARLAQERLAAELKEATEKVSTFLQARGFTKGIAVAKKSCMKTSYPLHVAVEENSAEMVKALLKCGADKAAKNSAGLTPYALAQKLHKKKGSYSDVLGALEN